MDLPPPLANRTAHRLGATCLGEGRCYFQVWAPLARQLQVHLIEPAERFHPLAPVGSGYFAGVVEGVEPGTRYYYRLDRERDRPDPASRHQPLGVHGPSEVVEDSFPWDDAGWAGLPLQDYLIYELHVGVYTAGGTFEAVIPHLDGLKDLGVTAVELMPVAQFPGERNWGYDGVGLFAAQASYGGPEGLKRLVNACHQRGLALVLDVVYNHLGPEGNYLGDYGPYFTDRYRTPWGAALNFDGPDSDQVRRFFIENALYWTGECHVDALRLDAVHAIRDHSPTTFLEDLVQAVGAPAARRNRRVHLIAESSDNDPRLLRSAELGGYGLDAQWSDDFHHCLHTLLTGESAGYYQDYGQISQLGKALREGFVYSGQHSPYRRRRHGRSSRQIPARQLVVCAQNHDQVGNRMLGERLSQLVDFEGLKLAAGALLLSPFVPLLFMGEEYGETAPFFYFVSHSDAALVDAVRRGRLEEFAAFQQGGQPPDPQAESTFEQARLDHSRKQAGTHRTLLALYRELIHQRRQHPALARLSKDCLEVVCYERSRSLFLRRWHGPAEAVALFHFGGDTEELTIPLPAGRWEKLLDSAEERWGGPGGRLAPELGSDGELSVPVGPTSFWLIQRADIDSQPLFPDI